MKIKVVTFTMFMTGVTTATAAIFGFTDTVLVVPGMIMTLGGWVAEWGL